MTINAPLLRKTLEHIEVHPEVWEQGTWAVELPACGTAGCFAFHAVVLAEPNAQVVFSEDRDEVGRREVTRVAVRGQERRISEAAIQLLGITELQADILFRASNSLNDLRAHVNGLCRVAEYDERVEAGVL